MKMWVGIQYLFSSAVPPVESLKSETTE
jgi:hypothetical protein